MATQIHIAQAMSQQSKNLQEFMTAMQAHQTNVRLDINRMEAIVGCIAKSSDEEVVKYLPDANQTISNLRECLSTLGAHRQIFELRQRSLDDGRSTS
jgi:hypothetical protein